MSVKIVETAEHRRRIVVEGSASSPYIRHGSWETRYPADLIELILKTQGESFLCDEIMREEHPAYVEKHLRTVLSSYLPTDDFNRKRILDFGCGCGASTIVLGRMLPAAQIVGIDLRKEFVAVAARRADYCGTSNVSFLTSYGEKELPKSVGEFDYILLHGVYEHLLPSEREPLLKQLWSMLRAGGVVFVDETPHRYLPVETHTSGLPVVNYLPDHIALWFVKTFSRRDLKHDNWETLQRKGIRGATKNELMKTLSRLQGGRATLLLPNGDGIDDRIDLWYKAYVEDSVGRSAPLKRMLKHGLKMVKALTGLQFTPYLSLAIQKDGY